MIYYNCRKGGDRDLDVLRHFLLPLRPEAEYLRLRHCRSFCYCYNVIIERSRSYGFSICGKVCIERGAGGQPQRGCVKTAPFYFFLSCCSLANLAISASTISEKSQRTLYFALSGVLPNTLSNSFSLSDRSFLNSPYTM